MHIFNEMTTGYDTYTRHFVHKSEELLEYDSRTYTDEIFLKQRRKAKLNLFVPYFGPQIADKVEAEIQVTRANPRFFR